MRCIREKLWQRPQLLLSRPADGLQLSRRLWFYSSTLPELIVDIVRFVDNNQPGWVECEFTDAEGRRHLIIEKVPGVTSENLDVGSKYPTPGAVRCVVLKRYEDETGRELVCISTASPWSIESTEGLSEFTVPAILITSVVE